MSFMLVRKKNDLVQMLGVYNTWHEARFIMNKNAKKKSFGKQSIEKCHLAPTTRKVL